MKTVAALAFALMAPLAQREPVPLERLTVPPGRLPAECQLAQPPQPARLPNGNVAFPSAALPGLRDSQNPWIGTDAPSLAALWELMEGHPGVPDAAPLDRRGAAQYQLRRAEGVERGYRATYTQPSGSILVLGLQMNESARAHASSLTKGRRVDLGTVVATVLGQPGACVNAIEAHLSSLKP